ncbi:MAG TPA: FAD-binding oxidoreductase [Chloroflexota bacterium]|nr:FAD-binding oxidoreductase [Chloroflexota bacterium]
MPATTPRAVQVRNWFGSIVSAPTSVVYPSTVDQLAAILTDPEHYPGPVRAVGSNHSTTPCGVADGGTLLVMRHFDRILDIGPDSVTVEAGALYIDVAKQLQRYGLQFYVNVELGNLSMGSAACGGTKDASMPGEFGQVCSYATQLKLVTPAGERVTIGEDQPDLLQAARSGYGLFGIVYEVTFKVRPLQAMAVHHESFTLDEFAHQLPELKTRGESIMLYLNPFTDRVTVELRRYRPATPTTSFTTFQWALRNSVWSTVGPRYSHLVWTYVRLPALRDALLNGFYRLVDLVLVAFIRGRSTYPTDQQIRYPEVGFGHDSRYTFSIWAFPEDEYIQSLRDYFHFCREYYRSTGYRCNITNVGYRIAHDTSSLFSYSFHGDVITFDPVSTGNPGWEAFLTAYNAFCSQRHGTPLFNQTNLLTRDQVRQAFGERVETFERVRRQYDPHARLVNPYFRELLGSGEGSA